MKTLVGHGPLRIALQPKARVPELAAFEISTRANGETRRHADTPIGWTATRRDGMMVESLRLETSIHPADSSSLDPDAEVEWKVTASCAADRARFGGPMAAGSTLLAGAFAFLVTYHSMEWLPRKPSLHFALATLILFLTFSVALVVLYRALAMGSRRLAERIEERKAESIRTRVDRLAAFAATITQLGLTHPDEGLASR